MTQMLFEWDEGLSKEKAFFLVTSPLPALAVLCLSAETRQAPRAGFSAGSRRSEEGLPALICTWPIPSPPTSTLLQTRLLFLLQPLLLPSLQQCLPGNAAPLGTCVLLLCIGGFPAADLSLTPSSDSHPEMVLLIQDLLQAHWKKHLLTHLLQYNMDHFVSDL